MLILIHDCMLENICRCINFCTAVVADCSLDHGIARYRDLLGGKHDISAHMSVDHDASSTGCQITPDGTADVH